MITAVIVDTGRYIFSITIRKIGVSFSHPDLFGETVGLLLHSVLVKQTIPV